MIASRLGNISQPFLLGKYANIKARSGNWQRHGWLNRRLSPSQSRERS